MYYVKSVNWCACCCYAYLLLPRADARFLRTKRGSCNAVRDLLNSGPDGGSCPPGYSLPCRGFTGECGDITSQFGSIPVLPDYPDGLADWNCHAFPDDDKPLDSFLVGLISVACAIPVTGFMQSCFEIANDSEAPEVRSYGSRIPCLCAALIRNCSRAQSWLEWGGWPKFVFGLHAHRQWHYTRDKPPPRYVRWYVRSSDAPTTETIENLWHSFVAFVTRTEPFWVIEAREAKEEAEAEAREKEHEHEHGSEAHSEHGSEHGSKHGEEGEEHESASTSSSIRSARALRAYKRIIMATGLFGVYLCWAIFAWLVDASCACAALPACACAYPAALAPAQVHLHVWLAADHAPGRGRAAVLRAQLGHQLRPEQRRRVPADPHRRRKGRLCAGGARAPVPDRACGVAGGLHRLL